MCHTLSLAHNLINSLQEIQQLQKMPSLKNLRLDGNPVFYYPVYREFAIAVLPQLTNLDGLQVTSYERQSASDVIKGER